MPARILLAFAVVLSATGRLAASPATLPTTEPAARAVREKVSDACLLLGLRFDCDAVRHAQELRFDLDGVTLRREDDTHPGRWVEVVSAPHATVGLAEWPAKDKPLRVASVRLDKPAVHPNAGQAPAPAKPPPAQAKAPPVALPDPDKLPWQLGRLFKPGVITPDLPDLRDVEFTDATVTTDGPAALTVTASGHLHRIDADANWECELTVNDLKASPTPDARPDPVRPANPADGKPSAADLGDAARRALGNPPATRP